MNKWLFAVDALIALVVKQWVGCGATITHGQHFLEKKGKSVFSSCGKKYNTCSGKIEDREFQLQCAENTRISVMSKFDPRQGTL
jgi:hypothetical protein